MGQLRPASADAVESTADLAHLSMRQRSESAQNPAHERPQMNHAVGRVFSGFFSEFLKLL